MSGNIAHKQIPGTGKYGINDMQFPLAELTSDFITSWSPTMTDRQLINVTNSIECAIIFAARLG